MNTNTKTVLTFPDILVLYCRHTTPTTFEPSSPSTHTKLFYKKETKTTTAAFVQTRGQNTHVLQNTQKLARLSATKNAKNAHDFVIICLLPCPCHASAATQRKQKRKRRAPKYPVLQMHHSRAPFASLGFVIHTTRISVEVLTQHPQPGHGQNRSTTRRGRWGWEGRQVGG